MYTIGQVAEMFSLPVSTLRYYDKEGLFPYLERESGIRRFSERELEALRVIECLKASGLEIKEIKQFMKWCTEGPGSFALRRELFAKRRAAVQAELDRLTRTMAMLEFKCWYYDEAVKYGSEEPLAAVIPDDLPPDIKKLWARAHEG